YDDQWVALAAAFLGAALVAEACAAVSNVHGTQGVGGSTSGGLGGDIGVGAGTAASSATTGTGGGPGAHCDPPSPDPAAFPCGSAGATRACYPSNLNPKTRGVGACKDGQQTCSGGTEFNAWGPCTGAVGPAAENCADGLDNNCDGLKDCMDPTCAGDPACN